MKISSTAGYLVLKLQFEKFTSVKLICVWFVTTNLQNIYFLYYLIIIVDVIFFAYSGRCL